MSYISTGNAFATSYNLGSPSLSLNAAPTATVASAASADDDSGSFWGNLTGAISSAYNAQQQQKLAAQAAAAKAGSISNILPYALAGGGILAVLLVLKIKQK